MSNDIIIPIIPTNPFNNSSSEPFLNVNRKTNINTGTKITETNAGLSNGIQVTKTETVKSNGDKFLTTKVLFGDNCIKFANTKYGENIKKIRNDYEKLYTGRSILEKKGKAGKLGKTQQESFDLAFAKYKKAKEEGTDPFKAKKTFYEDLDFISEEAKDYIKQYEEVARNAEIRNAELQKDPSYYEEHMNRFIGSMKTLNSVYPPDFYEEVRNMKAILQGYHYNQAKGATFWNDKRTYISILDNTFGIKWGVVYHGVANSSTFNFVTSNDSSNNDNGPGLMSGIVPMLGSAGIPNFGTTNDSQTKKTAYPLTIENLSKNIRSARMICELFTPIGGSTGDVILSANNATFLKDPNMLYESMKTYSFRDACSKFFANIKDIRTKREGTKDVFTDPLADAFNFEYKKSICQGVKPFEGVQIIDNTLIADKYEDLKDFLETTAPQIEDKTMDSSDIQSGKEYVSAKKTEESKPKKSN